jgi:hypothetical protein
LGAVTHVETDPNPVGLTVKIPVVVLTDAVMRSCDPRVRVTSEAYSVTVYVDPLSVNDLE